MTNTATRRIDRALKAHLKGDYPTALKRYASLGRKYPRDPRVAYFAALCAYSAQDIPLACSLMEHSIALAPGHAEAHYNLGKFLMDRGQEMDALECFLNAIQIRPAFPEALNNAGNVFLHAGDLDAAEDCYNRSLAIPTANPDALYNRSYLKLMKGDLRGGFMDYEARWKTPGYLLDYKRDFMTQQPRWIGAPLNGRRLLVVAEQGFGDTIHFVRYAPHLLEWIGPFALEVQWQLRDLLRHNLDPRITLIGRGDPVPECDVWTSLLSLPALFQGVMPPTPCPYLVPDYVESTGFIGKELPPSPGMVRRVGLCWAGSTGHKNDHNRSVPFEEIEVLRTVPNVHWVSLQIGPREAEANGAEWLEHAGNKWQTFMASARVVAGLDLVVTCDSATAHLAGALGVPTWVMIPKVPDYRWLLDRTDSPWYPTLRLYRQTTARVWSDVVARLITDMETGT